MKNFQACCVTVQLLRALAQQSRIARDHRGTDHIANVVAYRRQRGRYVKPPAVFTHAFAFVAIHPFPQRDDPDQLGDFIVAVKRHQAANRFALDLFGGVTEHAFRAVVPRADRSLARHADVLIFGRLNHSRYLLSHLARLRTTSDEVNNDLAADQPGEADGYERYPGEQRQIANQGTLYRTESHVFRNAHHDVN